MGKKNSKKKKKKKDKQERRPAKLGSGNCGNRQGELSIKSSSFLAKQDECDKDPVPDQTLLGRGTPGIPFGVLAKERLGDYVGVRRGAEGNIIITGGVGSGKSSGIAMPA